MGQRMVRVNELVKREISRILHTDFRSESVYISITDVEVSPDLRTAFIYYSVLGGSVNERKGTQFLHKIKSQLRRSVARSITLKYMPDFVFRLDHSIARGTSILTKIEEIEAQERAQHQQDEENFEEDSDVDFEDANEDDYDEDQDDDDDYEDDLDDDDQEDAYDDDEEDDQDDTPRRSRK